MVVTPAADPRVGIIELSRADPVAWTYAVLGRRITSYQADIMRAVRDHPRVAVRSCNSIGKDFAAGCIALWWVHQWDDAVVVTTAPTWHQVKDIQWHREISSLYYGAKWPLGGTMLDTEYRLSPRRAIMGLSTNNKEQLQGIHSEHTLIIVTEASAQEFDAELWEAIDTLAAGGRAVLLMLSNPTRQEGQFHAAFHDDAEQWVRLHVSAFDTPNLRNCAKLGSHQVPAQCRVVVPGLITHEWVEDMRHKHGEGSDFWRVHVLGDFPTSGADSVIPLAWVEEAMRREASVAGGGTIAAGCDLARKGKDMNALAIISDGDLFALEEWSDPSLMSTVGRLLRAIEAHGIQVLALDDTGLGGGVTDRLAELLGSDEYDGPDFLLVPVNFSTKARSAKEFHNKPSELWWTLRENLSPEAAEPMTLRGEVRLLSRLSSQLTKARYHYDSTGMGRIWVDKLGKIGERGHAEAAEPESPDLAEALCLALEGWLVYHTYQPVRRETVHYRESFLTNPHMLLR